MTYHDVVVETWEPKTFAWSVVQEFKRAEIRERHDPVDGGPTISFDLPDGKYGDGTQKVRRWCMEAPRPWLYMVEGNIFVGFVSVEVFADDQTPDFEGYLKQRWTIRPTTARRVKKAV